MTVCHHMAKSYRSRSRRMTFPSSILFPLRAIFFSVKVEFLSALNKLQAGIITFLWIGRAVPWPFFVLQKQDSKGRSWAFTFSPEPSISFPPHEWEPWRVTRKRLVLWPSKWQQVGKGFFLQTTAFLFGCIPTHVPVSSQVAERSRMQWTRWKQRQTKAW